MSVYIWPCPKTPCPAKRVASGGMIRGMFRRYVSRGYVSGYVSPSLVEIMGMIRGMIRGYDSGAWFGVWFAEMQHACDHKFCIRHFWKHSYCRFLFLYFILFFFSLSLSLFQNMWYLHISTPLIADIVRTLNKQHAANIWRYPKYIETWHKSHYVAHAQTNQSSILLCPARIRHHSELVQHASTDLSNNFNITFPRGWWGMQ